jgi:glycosyltransferase involved in cell wall biosynthesis
MNLFLGLISLKNHEVLGVTPPRVYFTTSSTLQDGPTTFDPNNPCWKSLQLKSDYRKTNELFNQLQDARVCGKTLLEFVWYDGVSMWQFLPSYIWPAFFRTVELIDVVSEIIDETAPQEIRIFPINDYTNPIWRGVVQAIGQAHNIPVTTIQPHRPHGPYHPSQRLLRILRRIGVNRFIWQIEYILLIPWIHWMVRLQRKVGNDRRGGKTLLFATLARHWVEVPDHPGRKYDEQFFPLLPALRVAGWKWFVGIDCPYSLLWYSMIKLWSRIRAHEPGVIWNIFHAYGKPCKGSLIKNGAVFAHMWQVLRNDPEFDRDFRYRNISLLPALMAELEWAFLHILPECARMLTIAGQILEQERPDAIMATYETGPLERALIIQSSRMGIPTVGLVHGMIFDNHYDYMHHRITTDPVLKPLGFVVPEITCVWGPATKQTLTEIGHYSSEAVVVTGNWRYDHLVAQIGERDIVAIKRRFRLKPGGKVVLILSAVQNTPYYIGECLNAIESHEDCVPLIKLHSADDPRPIRRLLQRQGYSTEILIERWLFEALMVADLVISQWSTVVSEAVLLGRPVVLVNLSNMPGPEAYVKAGICLYATNPMELASAIQKGLDDPAVRSKLNAARTEFIGRYFFKIDGRAAERVVEALERRLSMRSSASADVTTWK